MDKKINLACARVDGIEGKVGIQLKDMFVKFKEEMKICVKEMVGLLFMELVPAHCGTSRIPTAAPIEVPGSATVFASADDINANTIRNVVDNLSAYSTPPRSNRMSQVTILIAFFPRPKFLNTFYEIT